MKSRTQVEIENLKQKVRERERERKPSCEVERFDCDFYFDQC